MQCYLAGIDLVSFLKLNNKLKYHNYTELYYLRESVFWRVLLFQCVQRKV